MPIPVIDGNYNIVMNTRGTISEANRNYLNTKKNNPFDGEMYKLLAAKYLEKNKFRAAEICLRKALWFTPHDQELLKQLSRIYQQINPIGYNVPEVKHD